MGKKDVYTIVAILVILVVIAIIYLITLEDSNDEDASSNIPNRLAEIGPYATNISLTENIGTYALTISAERLHVKKGKFMGFNTALQKKYVINKLHLSLYKDRIKEIEIYKDRIIIDPLMKSIEIENPQILFPENMKEPIRVKLEKDNKLLKIYYANKVDEWNLAN